MVKHWNRGRALGVSSKINGTDPQHHGLTTGTENEGRVKIRNLVPRDRIFQIYIYIYIYPLAAPQMDYLAGLWDSLSQDNTSGLKAIQALRSSGQDTDDAIDDSEEMDFFKATKLFCLLSQSSTFSDTV